MPDYQPIDYRLRCYTKRTDLPVDVLRDIGEAYEEIERLRKELDARIAMCDMRSEKIGELANERDEARREICTNVTAISASMNAEQWARERGWDCFKKKTLKDCFKENT